VEKKASLVCVKLNNLMKTNNYKRINNLHTMHKRVDNSLI